MNTDKTIWNGLTLTGDSSELDRIIETQGYVTLDKHDIITTLSAPGQSHATKGTGPDLTTAFRNAAEALPEHIGNADRLLIQFWNGTRQATTDDIAGIADYIKTLNHDITVLWGIAQDDSIGESFKTTILAHFAH